MRRVFDQDISHLEDSWWCCSYISGFCDGMVLQVVSCRKMMIWMFVVKARVKAALEYELEAAVVKAGANP